MNSLPAVLRFALLHVPLTLRGRPRTCAFQSSVQRGPTTTKEQTGRWRVNTPLRPLKKITTKAGSNLACNHITTHAINDKNIHQ